MRRNAAKLSAFAAFVLFVLFGGTVGLSCSNGGSPKSGDVKLAVVLPDGTSIGTISYQILKSDASQIAAGSFSVADPKATVSLDVVVPVTPVGDPGDTVKLSATTSTGVSCVGTSAPFPIVAGSNTPVTMTLSCGTGTQPGPTGSIGIVATPVEGDHCPNITSAVVGPGELSVGGSAMVEAVASDADPTETLTYAWAPAANFTAPSAASTSYNCTATGGHSLTLTVTDSHTPTACSTQATLTIKCDSRGSCDTTVFEPPCEASCPQCEFTDTDLGVCFNTSPTGMGTSVDDFGCYGFTDLTDTANCLALLGCLRSTACQNVIHAAGSDYNESSVDFDDGVPCLCNNATTTVTLAACLGQTSWTTGICASQFVAASNNASRKSTPIASLYDPAYPVGVAMNLMTCDIDSAQPIGPMGNPAGTLNCTTNRFCSVPQ